MVSEKLNAAIAAIKAGNKAVGLQLLSEVVKADPNNETAWLWLSTCVDKIEQKKYCLSKSLSINPSNQNAQRALEQLESPPQPSFEEMRSVSSTESLPSASPGVQRIPSEAKEESRMTVGIPSSGRSVPQQSMPSQIAGTKAQQDAFVSRPWYRSSFVYFLTFLFLTPVWVVLILTDKKQSIGVKSLASIFMLFYIGFCCFLVLSSAPLSSFLSSYGTELTFNGGQLFYTSSVTEAEAKKLGQYLVENGFFDGNLKTVQINKSGNTYEFRMVVKKGIEQDESMVLAAKMLAIELSESVFNNAPVDIHFCDERLETIRVIVVLR